MHKDLLKLLALLGLLAILMAGIHFAGKSVDNRSKYQHPITQPGARW
ncbi:MAG: hypothetical protein R6W66_02900 [Pelovirga sp.]|jgi:hypothetical protein